MIKYIMSRKINERGIIGIGLCILIFIFGELVLNCISTMENPPMGNTIYILIGSAFRFISVLGVVIILKYLYDSKKKKERRERKRKGHKLYYLKDNKTNKNQDSDL
jgi:purine-cytosine permease-like protein